MNTAISAAPITTSIQTLQKIDCLPMAQVSDDNVRQIRWERECNGSFNNFDKKIGGKDVPQNDDSYQQKLLSVTKALSNKHY